MLSITDEDLELGRAATSVEIRDVAIPRELQDAMSRQAQAEREKEARVTLASAEQEIARQVLEAAKLYDDNPTALRLRQMNLLYEMNKERGTTGADPDRDGVQPRRGGRADEGDRPRLIAASADAFVHQHVLAAAQESLALAHADRTQHHAAGEIVLRARRRRCACRPARSWPKRSAAAAASLA